MQTGYLTDLNWCTHVLQNKRFVSASYSSQSNCFNHWTRVGFTFFLGRLIRQDSLLRIGFAFLRYAESEKRTLWHFAGLIKSYSPTSRTSDFWGQTSKNLPFSSPRTTGFFQSTCPKLLLLRCHKVLFPVNSYYLLPVNPDVWSPSWLFCGGKAWHLFLKDFTHFCATSFYPFVLLLILLLKGFKNFLMLVPSTNDKND